MDVSDGWGPDLSKIPQQAEQIPNIELQQIYDRCFAQDDIQYGNLKRLAELLTRNPLPHRHDGYVQIHYIEAGSFELWLDSVRHEADGPAIFLTPQGVPHAFSLTDNARGHVLTLRQDVVEGILKSDPETAGYLPLVPFCERIGGAGERRNLALCFHLLREEMANAEPGGRVAMEGAVRLLLAKALRYQPLGDRGHERSSGDLAIYRRFLGLVESGFKMHATIPLIARDMGVSEWRLNKAVKACANTSPKVIVHRRILQEARSQLAFTDANIGEISDFLGFSEIGYFSRFFVGKTGMSPSAYRSQIRQGAISRKSPK